MGCRESLRRITCSMTHRARPSRSRRCWRICGREPPVIRRLSRRGGAFGCLERWRSCTDQNRMRSRLAVDTFPSGTFTWMLCAGGRGDGRLWGRSWFGLANRDPHLKRSGRQGSLKPLTILRDTKEGANRFETVRLFSRAHAVLPVRPDEPNQADGERNADYQVELVEVFAQAAPVLAKLHAEIGQCETPGPRSQEGVDMKLAPGHAGDAGGESDKGADHGKQAANQDRSLSPTLEEAVCPVDFAAAHQDPSSVLFYQGSSTVKADLIRHE